MRILCELPNAGEEISGVKFEPVEGGMASVGDIDGEQAAIFLSIPGFRLLPEEGEPEPDLAEPAAAVRRGKRTQQ